MDQTTVDFLNALFNLIKGFFEAGFLDMLKSLVLGMDYNQLAATLKNLVDLFVTATA